MKSFASFNIKARLINRLKQTDDWKNIIEDSAIDSLLTQISEMEAEDVRYFEHLFRENTWNQAQNLTSLQEQALLLGYKPKRKISAIGTLTFSPSDLTDIQENGLDSLTGSSFDITIPARTVIEYNSISFITTESVSISLGDKYVEVPVIQGSLETISTDDQKMLGIPFQKIKINNNSIEAALDTVSSSYFSVQITLPNGTTENCYLYDNIFLASSLEYAYQINHYFDDYYPDNDYIELKFGNNVTGKIPPINSIITLNYLSTLGLSGNVAEIGVINGNIIIDGKAIYYKNYTPVLGGKDREDVEDIRANAPKNYLLDGPIITIDQYKKAIEEIAYVYKATVYSGVYDTKDAIIFSAIDTYGNAPDSENIENDLEDRIVNRKSPMDIVKYTEPNFIDLQFNFKANRISSNIDDITTLSEDIKSLVYNSYGILSTEFKESIENNDLGSFILKNYSTIENSVFFLLAKKYLQPSTFIVDSLNTYSKTFSFDECFEQMYKDTFLPFFMRIDIVFACEEVEENSRTLFIINNPDYNSGDPESVFFLIKQFQYIPTIVDNAYMQDLLDGSIEAYQEIEDTDIDNYINFAISIEKNDVLMETTLSIPTTFIEFNTLSSTELDNCLKINAYAYPQNYNNYKITPLTNNSIIRITEDDILVEIS